MLSLLLIACLFGIAQSLTTQSTILILARDDYSSKVASSGLNGYGIPYYIVQVPQAGVTLPTLANNATGTGNYGGIVVASQVSYDYGEADGGFRSALTTEQWNQLYAYQVQFGVRMVQYDVYPTSDFGTTPLGGCCDSGVEQNMYFTDTTEFSQAGFKTNEGISTANQWHYPSTISDPSIATEIAQFEAAGSFSSPSTAAVINNINGRQQMVFFISWATDWSPTSAVLQHAWITYITRGLYSGYRRVYLGTQIDDMFLESDIYYPSGNTYRLNTADLSHHATWTGTINGKMNPGSDYFMEVGHNGNGNIEYAANSGDAGWEACNEGPIDYEPRPDTELEFQKPLGTGTDVWPETPTQFDWPAACYNIDPLKQWWSTPANRDKFAHVSHTFTHYELNNATASDASKEIAFNQAWFAAIGLDQATHWSPKGLIPPAITGLHNGDALRSWSQNGLTNCVGDNTRSVLRNSQNEMWPYITNFGSNGFAGFTVVPRWATRIYYNCDSTDCTVQEWIDTSAGQGDIGDLLEAEKSDTIRHLFGLYHDPYMFHQANLRQADVGNTVVNGVSQKLSLIEMWVETIVAEFTRFVDWPIITLKHDDIAASFTARMARDSCKPNISYNLDSAGTQITGVTVTTNGNTCSTAVPVTFPGDVTNTQGFETEKVGNDPLTIWVKMAGGPVTFTLSTPIAL